MWLFDLLLPGSAQQQSSPAASVVSPCMQGIGNQFTHFQNGTIDVGMHKIEDGVAA